jgi:hypothetical protein
VGVGDAAVNGSCMRGAPANVNAVPTLMDEGEEKNEDIGGREAAALALTDEGCWGEW